MTDCLNKCDSISNCQSVNFETGLCILFSSSAAQNPVAFNLSQFPVFTIYAQKICSTLTIDALCNRAWLFETVPRYSIKKFIQKTVQATSKVDCIQQCIMETKFKCRSVNFNFANHECNLSKMDRHTMATLSKSERYFGSSMLEDYLENNCIEGMLSLSQS